MVSGSWGGGGDSVKVWEASSAKTTHVLYSDSANTSVSPSELCRDAPRSLGLLFMRICIGELSEYTHIYKNTLPLSLSLSHTQTLI